MLKYIDVIHIHPLFQSHKFTLISLTPMPSMGVFLTGTRSEIVLTRYVFETLLKIADESQTQVLSAFPLNSTGSKNQLI